MMDRSRFPLPVMVGLMLTGCLPEELPVPPRTMAHGQYEAQVCMGTGYGDQIWFHLGTGSTVARHSKMDWDLAFAGHPGEAHVRLNGARMMRAHRLPGAAIDQPTDTTGLADLWRYDHSAGSPDSLAIGRWWEEPGTVYVIDLGHNLFGSPMGLRKMQVLSMTDTEFTIRIARLDGTQVEERTVQKDPSRRHVHFDLRSRQQVDIAPEDGAYDILFTGYNYQFYDPYMVYAVSGVLNGFSGARVARVTNPDMEAVTLADTLAHPFSTDEDAIGYDWKLFDLNTNTYHVFPQQVYIVHTADGRFHKLRFTGYYDPSGSVGCPRFEVATF